MRSDRLDGWVRAAIDINELDPEYVETLANGMELGANPTFEEVMDFFDTLPAELGNVADTQPGLPAGHYDEPPAAEIQDCSSLDKAMDKDARDHFTESSAKDVVQFQFDAPTLIHSNEPEKYGVETEEQVLETKQADDDLRIDISGNYLEIHERSGRDDYEQLFRDGIPYNTTDMEKEGIYFVEMEDDPVLSYNNGVLTVEVPLSYRAACPDDDPDAVY